LQPKNLQPKNLQPENLQQTSLHQMKTSSRPSGGFFVGVIADSDARRIA
jgi:hypothetical protein